MTASIWNYCSDVFSKCLDFFPGSTDVHSLIFSPNWSECVFGLQHICVTFSEVIRFGDYDDAFYFETYLTN